MSILTALKVILPNLPAIKQVLTRPKTGVKEATGITIGMAIFLVYGDYTACGGFSCVSAANWGILVTSVIALIARLNAMAGE